MSPPISNLYSFIKLYYTYPIKSIIKSNLSTFVSSVDSLDWKDLSAAQITERITSKITNGSIVLLHNGAKNTPAALPSIIEGIRAQGYELVPISELVPEGEYTTDHEGRMHLCE